MQWISPVRYAFEALCIAEYYPRGMQAYVEVELGFTQLNFTTCCVMLLVLSVISRFLAIIVLKANIDKVQ